MTDSTNRIETVDRGSGACCGGCTSRLDDDQAAALAARLGAVADPVRLHILSIIASSADGEVCACDFVGPIGRSQPTISHHLKVLNEVGLVEGDKRGRWIWYRLAPGAVDELAGALAESVRPSEPVAVTGA